VNTQEIILREKLDDYFSSMFEDELIDEIVQVGYIDKLKNDEILIDIGETMTHIPLILNGVVKVIRKEKKGHELVLYFLERGDTCAISFVNCLPASSLRAPGAWLSPAAIFSRVVLPLPDGPESRANTESGRNNSAFSNRSR